VCLLSANHFPRFWLRIPKTATTKFRRRFKATWIDYVNSVVQQAKHRSESRILELEEYLAVRRYTSGAASTIAIHEMDSDIPDEIRESPVIRELETLAVDLISLANVSPPSRLLKNFRWNQMFLTIFLGHPILQQGAISR
jgi:hypothetical protein